MCIRVHSNCGEHLDACCFLRAVSQRQSHLSVSERLGGVRTEAQLGSEHSLTLETSTLTNEQMVVVTLRMKQKMVSKSGHRLGEKMSLPGEAVCRHQKFQNPSALTYCRLTISQIEHCFPFVRSHHRQSSHAI